MENIIKEEVEKRSIAKTLNCILGVARYKISREQHQSRFNTSYI